MQLRTLIVDDDTLARSSLERLVRKNDHLVLQGSCQNGKEGSSFLSEHEVDLVLLDVEMPEMDGFSLIESLEYTPKIIMTTQKEEYAFQAFRYEVFDYLKKPITVPGFNSAINKLIVHLEKEGYSSRSSESKKNIFLKVDNKLVNVAFQDIFYAENIGDYIKIVLENKSHIVHATMKTLDSRLPSDQFMRVHRSFIVNLEHIQDVEQNSLLIGERLIPVSRSSKNELMTRLNTL